MRRPEALQERLVSFGPELDHTVVVESLLAPSVGVEPFDDLESGQRPDPTAEKLPCFQNLQVELEGFTAPARPVLEVPPTGHSAQGIRRRVAHGADLERATARKRKPMRFRSASWKPVFSWESETVKARQKPDGPHVRR